MKLDPDSCLSCGSHARPQGLDVPSDCHKLNSNGTLDGLWGYWFCSVPCYKREVRKFFEDEMFDFDYEVTEEFAERYAHSYARQTSTGIWDNLFNSTARYEEGFEDLAGFIVEGRRRAVDELIRRVKAEDQHWHKEEMRKQADEQYEQEQRELEKQQRERERQQLLEERRREQARRETEREAEKAERLAERHQREAERRAEQRRREQEKWEAEERKRREQEAEEAKWRPRNFEI